MKAVQRGAVALLVIMTTSGVAVAEDHALYERLWPQAPHVAHLSLSQQITDQLTLLGNTIGDHLGALSHGELALRFDGRRRRAHVRFGSNDAGRYLVFRFAGDVHFTDGVARVQARVDLGIAGHVIQLELPDVEMAPVAFRGDRGVEVRLPLFRRTF